MHRRSMLGLSAALFALQVLPARAASHTVVIKGMKFTPPSLDIAVGDTITFENQDATTHTATAKDGAFDTGKIAGGQSASVTVNAAGKHDYNCAIHTSMKGVVNAS